MVRIFWSAILLALLAACAAYPQTHKDSLLVNLRPILPKKSVAADILDDGWHTGWVLPARPFLEALPSLRPYFPHAQVIMVGWGNRYFYEAHHPGAWRGLQALFPSSSVVLIQGIPHKNWRSFLLPNVRLLALPLSPDQFQKLMQYIASYIVWKHHDRKNALREAWYPHGVFFPSDGTYDAFHTCNTWTAQSLHFIGYPVTGSGVLFAAQVEGLWKAISPLIVKSK